MNYAKGLSALILAVLVISCGKNGAADFSPDFSTPESAFNTLTHAVKNKNFSLSLECMTEAYRLNFGKTKEEQLQFLTTHSKGMNVDPSLRREIIEVRYGEFEGYDAEVIYREFVKGKLFLTSAVMPMKKVGNEWKVTDYPEKEPTPEEIREAEETKELLKKDWRIDEERGIVVPVDSQGHDPEPK